MFNLRCTFRMAAGFVLFIVGSSLQAGTFFVAPDGSDANPGSDRAQAWRTVNHAADQVRAGDTVLIAGGTYTEAVRIRTTGEQGKPITFKAIPGEKVILSGGNGALTYAFYAAHKSHLNFDGLYFSGFSGLDNYVLPWSDRAPGNGTSGMIALYRCKNINITRCFSDSRMPVYSPGLLQALECQDLLVQNCVVASSMGGGVAVLFSPNTTIEHCVFLVPLIHATYLQNNKGQAGTLMHNIFTDNIHSKRLVPFLYNSEPFDANTGNNCFFPRLPAAERKWDEAQGTLQQWITKIAAARGVQPDDQLAVDPGFRGALNAPELDSRGKPLFKGDFLMGKEKLDFSDLFPTNPQVISRGMGLQPEAFADMLPQNSGGVTK